MPNLAKIEKERLKNDIRIGIRIHALSTADILTATQRYVRFACYLYIQDVCCFDGKSILFCLYVRPA
jgi:hypothetical protein